MSEREESFWHGRRSLIAVAEHGLHLLHIAAKAGLEKEEKISVMLWLEPR